MFTTAYAVYPLSVPDGVVTVGRWGSGPTTVLALHGVTANHAEFHALADALGDDVTLLAPDLRGRAGSRDVGPPFGMEAHADDVAAVLREHGHGPAVLVGHSMGGFAAVVTAARYPELVSAVVLVDGGLPLDLGPLAGLPAAALLQAVLGPSMDRLRMTFNSIEDYFAFWRQHPALGPSWSAYVERYLEADLIEVAGVLRASAREEAVVQDTESDLGTDVVARALAEVRQPVILLRAERGVLDQVPPLYLPDAVDKWRATVPQLRDEPVAGSNHFTIALAPEGAQRIASAVLELAGVTDAV